MLNYLFKASFTRQFKKLESRKKKQIIEAIESLKTLFGSGQNPEGLGLKRLSSNIWEIRSTLKDRILFTYENEAIVFVLVGNHDEISRYLKGL